MSTWSAVVSLFMMPLFGDGSARARSEALGSNESSAPRCGLVRVLSSRRRCRGAAASLRYLSTATLLARAAHALRSSMLFQRVRQDCDAERTCDVCLREREIRLRAEYAQSARVAAQLLLR